MILQKQSIANNNWSDCFDIELVATLKNIGDDTHNELQLSWIENVMMLSAADEDKLDLTWNTDGIEPRTS